MGRDFQFLSGTDGMPQCQMPDCERLSITGWRLADRWLWLRSRHTRLYEQGCILHLPGERDIIRRRRRAQAMEFV